jgi:hypothetical protein
VPGYLGRINKGEEVELAKCIKRLDLAHGQVDADGGLAKLSADGPPAFLAAVNGLTNPASDCRDNRVRLGES